MPAEPRSPDPDLRRARLRRAAWLTLPCILVTVVVVGLFIAGELGDHTQQIVYGYVAMLLFFFLSAPMHLVLGAVATINAHRSRDRRGLWIHLYFVAWLVVHGVFLVAHGFHEPVVGAIRRWVQG